jgi:hypothetical protein
MITAFGYNYAGALTLDIHQFWSRFAEAQRHPPGQQCCRVLMPFSAQRDCCAGSEWLPPCIIASFIRRIDFNMQGLSLRTDVVL